MEFTREDFDGMESRYRAALINSLSGYKPANLVGTVDARGRTNLAIMTSAVHLGSNPPLLALVVRPGQEDRHTLGNILANGCYSINHVHPGIVEQSHQTAARYDRDESEFSSTGLTEHWRAGFAAPLVHESRLRMGLHLREHQELAINGTHLVIGEIAFVEFPGECLQNDGHLDLHAAESVAVSGLDSYHRGQRLKRMAYAKPELPPRVIA